MSSESWIFGSSLINTNEHETPVLLRTLKATATSLYREHVIQTKDLEHHWESLTIKGFESQNVSSDWWLNKSCLLAIAASSAYLLIFRHSVCCPSSCLTLLSIAQIYAICIIYARELRILMRIKHTRFTIKAWARKVQRMDNLRKPLCVMMLYMWKK